MVEYLKNQDFVVINAPNTEAGIEAEYEYINQVYGAVGVAWYLVRQRVMTCTPSNSLNPVEVDILTIKLSSGELRDIFFDISSFYGK